MTDPPLRVTLVLDPDLTFERISNAMIGAGWKVVDRSAASLLPREPEHAVFEPKERRTAGRVQYTFNPVCQLRVLEVEGPQETLSLPDLPVADPVTVAIWLQSDDERAVLRGILAARNLREPGLLDRVERHVTHPRGAIAQAARSAVEVLRATVAGRSAGEAALRGAVARADSLESIRLLQEQLRPLLLELGRDAGGGANAALRPRPDDYDRAFLPRFAREARAAFEKVWSEELRVAPVPPDWSVESWVAPAGMLAYENELSRHFPGGYQGIAPMLDPHRVWVRWRYLRPGQNAGQSYDGLVWLDDHWAWFPKPYRVLKHLASDSIPRS